MKARYAHNIFSTFRGQFEHNDSLLQDNTMHHHSFDDIIVLVEYQSPKAFCLPEVVL